MRFEITKEHTPEYCALVLKGFERSYGSTEKLAASISEARCADPAKADDLMIWNALAGGIPVTEREVFLDYAVFTSITPRRVELLDYLKTSEPGSIKELAEDLSRDYKNVYDDVKALARAGLVELVKCGKSLMPICLVTRVTIEVT